MTLDRDGIEVPREVADAEGLPEELDANVVGEYSVPDPIRRATSAKLYLGGAAVSVIGALTGLGDGMWWMASGLVALGVYHFSAAWRLTIREAVALETAGKALDFTVGHASAAVRFHGFRAKPEWNVILYDATEPPSQRALVFVDAVTGELRGEPFIEAL